MQLTNNLSQAVNVYVTPTGGSELFLRQVAGEHGREGAGAGRRHAEATVTFKAVTVDGSRTYQSRNVAAHGLLRLERALIDGVATRFGRLALVAGHCDAG